MKKKKMFMLLIVGYILIFPLFVSSYIDRGNFILKYGYYAWAEFDEIKTKKEIHLQINMTSDYKVIFFYIMDNINFDKFQINPYLFFNEEGFFKIYNKEFVDDVFKLSKTKQNIIVFLNNIIFNINKEQLEFSFMIDLKFVNYNWIIPIPFAIIGFIIGIVIVINRVMKHIVKKTIDETLEKLVEKKEK